jgi:hypothetical protein
MTNLRKLFFTTAYLIACIGISQAQELSIRGGFNLSEINYKAGNQIVHKQGAVPNSGFNVGAILDLPLKNMFSLETGILFTKKGLKIVADRYNYLYRMDLYYSEVPFLFKATYQKGKTKIFGMAGGYVASALFGYYIGAGNKDSVNIRIKDKVDWGNPDNPVRRFDYGLKFGIGMKIKDYQLGATYSLGLFDFWRGGSLLFRNRVLEFYVAYTIKSWHVK